MSLNIPLAGWILSVIAFLVGSIPPIIYRRLSYDGISLKQLYSTRAVLQQPHQLDSGSVTFSTIIKIANARKESLLLDNITVSSLSVSGIEFRLIGTNLHFLRADEIPHFPFADTPDWVSNDFPLIIKSDEEKIIGIDFLFQSSLIDSKDVTHILFDHIGTRSLPVRFKINGKYRDYVVRIPKDEAEQLVGQEQRERVSHQAWRDEG